MTIDRACERSPDAAAEQKDNPASRMAKTQIVSNDTTQADRLQKARQVREVRIICMRNIEVAADLKLIAFTRNRNFIRRTP
jgi:hypothetical protein